MKRRALAKIGGAACAVAGVILLAAGMPGARAQFPAAPGTGPGLAETIEAIDRARVTTRILYVTAHPDDESGAVLTYLARGLHADVALLSVTRGEGGQNDLGPEQAPQLGLIRTQELLAATRGYGVKLYFTRAKDFGFSKTPEETEKVWGDSVMEDMVRVIREFRPNIVINNWGGVHQGHGHHQTAGVWTPKAVRLAGDANAFRQHLAGQLPAWSGEDGRPVRILDLERGEKLTGTVLPLDDVSPLWGKSYRQIGMDAFANHRTQGISLFFSSPFFRRPMALAAEGGGEWDEKELAEPLRTILKGCPVFAEVDDQLSAARSAALQLDWAMAARDLATGASKAAHWMDICPWHLTPSVEQKFQVADMYRPLARIEKALELAAGLQFAAEADRKELVSGESFGVKVSARCRAESGCVMGETKVLFRGNYRETKREGDVEKGLQINGEILPDNAPPEPSQTQRVMAALAPHGPDISAELEELQPEPTPAASVQQMVTVDGYELKVTTPVTYVQTSSSSIERVPVRLVPAYTLMVEPRQEVELLNEARKPFDVLLRVKSHATQAGKVSVVAKLPSGWSSSGPVAVEFAGAGDKYARLTITPPEKLAAGNYKIGVYARREGGSGAKEEEFDESLEPLPTMPAQMWREPAECVVHAFRMEVPKGLRVGYITAENEPVPEALRRIGMQVEMLDAAALAFGDLARFDAIVVGVRAYELRPDLVNSNQRLLDYVSNGGTLVVQYQRDIVWDKLQPAPYPAVISPPVVAGKEGVSATPRPLPRITDENSPVKFLLPEDGLLNRPNKITQEDFQGWVQERGLYFWTQFDPKYTAVLAMNDPGEPELKGALVYTRYGKGTYIYTGMAFFRQIPEGVAGAYRLFVNLLSGSRERR